MTNKISYLLLIILLGTVLPSCKKLIEIPANPKDQLSKDRVFSDSANIIAAVAGVYSDYGVSSSYSPGFASGAITVYTGLTADELMPGSDVFGAPPFYNNAILPDNSSVRAMWSAAYKSIFEINLCLEGIAGTSAISEGLKRQLTGELKVNRAFCYFNMVNLWGGVPVIASTDYKATQHIPRASGDDVFSFILTDLVDAQKNLLPDYPSAGHARPNLYTAQALLAKVYLYLGQYDNSVKAANSVINSNRYSLPALSKVFLNGSPEAIWQLPANGTYRATPEGSAFIPYNSTTTPNYLLSPNLVNAFETGDQRKLDWTAFNTIGGAAMYYPAKYKNVEAGQTPVEDYMFLRLADLYLIRAEALARKGNVSDALSDLNDVRNRAGLADLNTASQQDAIKAILHERQVELFCEWGNRWFDLKRTQTIDAVLSAEKSSWKPTAALFPIPTAELQANTSLIPNPGY